MEWGVLALSAIALVLLVGGFWYSRSQSARTGRFRHRDGVTPGMWPAASRPHPHRHDDDDLDGDFDGDGDGSH